MSNTTFSTVFTKTHATPKFLWTRSFYDYSPFMS